MKSKTRHNCWVILLSAGKGTRFGGNIPKCYKLVAGRPIISWSIKTFSNHEEVKKILPVINSNDKSLALQSIENQNKCLMPIAGGSTRLHSLIIALKWIKKQSKVPDSILVHDAARPIIPDYILNNIFDNYNKTTSCIFPVLPISDSLSKCKINGENKTGVMYKVISRNDVNIIQTPQLYNFKEITSVLLSSTATINQHIKNDIPEWEILQNNKRKILCILGDISLSKLTYPNDLSHLEFILEKNNKTKSIFKTCLGYDIHRFSTIKRNLWLGGILIPEHNGLEGHSDADVLLHALCDAIYGLSTYGDIGIAFPPTENKWKNSASSIFVKHALQTLKEKNGILHHIDCSIVAEQPQISKYRENIILSLSKLTGLTIENISLKATTNEKLGCIGRSEGIASWVVCSASFS